MKRKRKIFETPEEREAWEIRSEAMDRMIRDRIERLEAELRAKDPNYRGLDTGSSRSRPSAKPKTRPDGRP